MELKTVQVNDELKISRPCIDAANIGYNVEWSQELRVHESLDQYVQGAMLIHMLRHAPGVFGSPFGDAAAAALLSGIPGGIFASNAAASSRGICSLEKLSQSRAAFMIVS